MKMFFTIIALVIVVCVTIAVSYSVGQKKGLRSAVEHYRAFGWLEVDGRTGEPFLFKRNCSGSWPDSTWKEEDYILKAKRLEECRKLYGTANERKTWE